MSHRHRAHVWLYRRALDLAPRSHRERHGQEQTQLFNDLLATGHTAWRLWLQLPIDLLTVIFALNRKKLMSHLARLALVPLSLLSIIAGTLLATISVTTAAIPLWVAVPAVAMAFQGLYTLAWLADRTLLSGTAARNLFVAGEGAALLVGGTGLVIALMAHAGASDPEYAPLTILALVLVHGLVGVLAALNDRQPAGAVA